jgi:hypothetical protein
LVKSEAEAPPDYVFAVILNQVSHDLHLIERVANQRSVDSSEAQVALDTAQQLAQNAFDAVVYHGGPLFRETPTVITYFEKSPSIRIIPYAPVALIGVPSTAKSVGRDHLATAHEVGHYVYWRGRYSEGSNLGAPIYRVFNEALKASPNRVRRWAEEIFADVYGCMIAGSLMALSSQDLALQRSLPGFIADDEEHPTPVLRPLIYRKVLRRIAEEVGEADLETSSDNLEIRWREKLAKRGNPISPVTIDVALQEVNDVIEAAVDILKPYLPSERWSDDRVDILDFSDPKTTNAEQVEAEYEQFKPVGVPSTTTALPELEEKLWDKWVIEEEGFLNEIPPEAPILAGSLKDFDLANPPDGSWVYVLHAGGWTTEIGTHGPGG